MLKNVRRGRIKEYAEKYSEAVYAAVDPALDHNPLWNHKADCAFPSATQNEINAKDAQNLINNGVFLVSEGANMPTEPDGVDIFLQEKLLYGPGKAANAGGVAVSGLEMSQNSMRLNWTREEVDKRLHDIMINIHENCRHTAEEFGEPGNNVLGANIAGFRKIAERFLNDPKEFNKAFAKAWFKLTHRDLGPRARYVGSEIPEEVFIWQDPVPPADYVLSDSEADKLKAKILKSGLTVPELVRTAWASASTFRGSDMRGGANGARIRLAPQKDWQANDPQELARVLSALEKIQKDFGKEVSMADLIVLGGAAAIEKAASDAGHEVKVPFTPGRGDATQEMTDVLSFNVLEPKADAFRNYYTYASYLSPTKMMVEKADLLTLTVRPRGRPRQVRMLSRFYSVHRGELLRTSSPAWSFGQFRWGSGGAAVELGEHPVADRLRRLDVSPKPINAVNLLRYRAMMPLPGHGLGGPLGNGRSPQHRVRPPEIA